MPVREHIPLEQGLRLRLALFAKLMQIHVREHIPLEQGLRQEKSFAMVTGGHAVREHIPLEQGLRLIALMHSDASICQRAYSIRTRIKTHYIRMKKK